MVKLTGTFPVTSDDGKQDTLYRYAEYLDAGSGEFIEGWSELRISNGAAVNWIKKGEYQIVSNGLKLYSNSPDAP